jgi:mRNA-degrading endonuclease RelE of RelBE toxin-antitoxin system
VLGTQLQGDQYLKNYRFRVGNYRIIARLEKRLLIIAVLEVGHRGDIYR